MDITTSLAGGVANLAKPKAGAVDNLAEPRNQPAQDSDGDRDNRIVQSGANFSAASLQLASTQVTPAVGNQTQISNSNEAMEAVSRLVVDSQNNPGQLQRVYSNVSAANTGRLLA